MRKLTKCMSLFVALTLAASLIGGTVVSAEDNSSQPAASGTTAPEPSAPSVSSYSVSDFSGDRWTYGQTANITVRVYDPVAAAENAVVNATINSGAFSCKSDQGTNNGDETYTFEFQGVSYSGGSTELALQLSYIGISRPIQNVSVALAQCDPTIPAPEPEPAPAPEPTPAPEPVYKTPSIIVKQSSFGGTEVQAGKEFTLELTIFTTSGNEGLNDVLVGLTLPKDVTLAKGNLNSFVGAVGPEGTRKITYQILPSVNFVDGVANIGVTMSGVGQNSNQAVNATTTVSVPVVLPERFDITNMEVPETMMLGEEGYLSVTYVNKGKGRINNLSAEITGENLANPGQSQFMGNVEPGTENSVDFSVMASEEGIINGKVILTYEDDRGEEVKLEKEFTCTVEPMMDMEPDMSFPGEEEMEEPKAGMPWWGWLLIVLGVAGVAVAVVLVVRRKKQAKALAMLEEEDEDL